MTNPKTKNDKPKNDFLSLLETILFICCIVVLAFRTTHTESPTPHPSQIQAVINDAVYSIVMSGILIFSLLLLLLGRLLTGRFSYKTASLEIGLIILLIASPIAAFFAPDKRAAITVSLTMLAPLFMAILLVQLLGSHAKIKILLITIITLGIYASWQSAEQVLVSDAIMRQQFLNDPNTMLEQLGIAPGSLNQMLLEHRISSKGARASFTTSNSAGSFMILASFAAIALFADRLKARKAAFAFAATDRSAPAQMINFLLAGAALAIVLFGLVLTRSKGAIAAFVLASAVFAILLGSKRRKLSKNIILACCVLAVIILIPLAAWFGLKSGRLPGGNSMLVRWQYWKASAQMAADYPLTGVGPGNFDTLYHRYKTPSAVETISDPHCFLLSILTQYGPLGLLGFLLFVLVPLWRSSLAVPADPVLDSQCDPPFKKLSAVCVIAVAASMFLLRPFILPASTAQYFDEKLYVFLGSYVTPAAVFIIGFVMLIKAIQTARTGEYALQNTSVTAIALFAGLFGVLIHNLIDFAIFEPGVLMTFCAILACLVALGSRISTRPAITISSPIWLKITATAVVCVIGFCYFNYALLPVIKSTAKIAKAAQPAAIGRFPLAHNLLEAAATDDPLSPDAPLKNGRLYLQHLYSPTMPREQMLDNAEQSLFIAAQRNPVDYKIFESLTDLYSARAHLKPAEQDQWLDKALETAAVAVELYPGNADLHFSSAQIADQLGKTDDALKHYEMTVQIEDGFREQFRLMYPGRKVISRLDEDKFNHAKRRADDLLKKSPR